MSAIVQRGNRVHWATDLLHFSEHELPSANMAAIQKKSTRSLFEIGLAADVLLDVFICFWWKVMEHPKEYSETGNVSQRIPEAVDLTLSELGYSTRVS